MKLVCVLLLLCLAVGARCEQDDGDDYLDGSDDCAAKAQEISTLTGKLTTAEAKTAQLQAEVERNEGYIMQWKNYAESIKGQLDAANTRLEGMDAEKEAAVKECYSKTTSTNSEQESTATECKRDLQAASGAKTEMEKQLRESAARIQLLTSDLKKQQTDSVGNSARIKELKETVASLQAKLDSQSWAPAWAAPVLDSVSPYIQTVKSSPLLQDAFGTAKRMSSEAYEAAQPLLKQAKEKAEEAYVASQPAMKDLSSKSQEAYGIAKEKAAAAYDAAQVKATEILGSDTVANIKTQGTQSVSELKSLLKTQMASIPSLAPYAVPETIDMIVYAILGMPFLFLFSMFAMCCSCRGKKSQPVESQAGGGSKKKRGHKARSGFIADGEDRVRYSLQPQPAPQKRDTSVRPSSSPQKKSRTTRLR